MLKKSKILDLDLTLTEKVLEPFWNEVSQEYHALLWQPQVIESLEQGSVLSKESLNYQVDESSFWKKTLMNQKHSIQNPLLVSSQAILRLIMERDLPKENQAIIATKKIRIYPEDENKFHRATAMFRRAYNLSIEAFKTRNENPSSELRKQICDQVKEEFEDAAIYDLSAEAYRRACETRKTIIKKRKSKSKCDYSFMSFKYSPHYFQIMKMRENVWKRSIGEFFLTEELPEESLLKVATVYYQNGEWYICVQKHIEIQATVQSNGSIVSLDSGVRTFQTTYSESQAIKYGEGFFKDKIFPLLLKVDKLYGKRQNLENVREKYGETQWFRNRYRSYEKRINRIKARINHLIQDLHHRVAYDLVSNYDVILLPTFETSEMTEKMNRKINTKVVRSMLGLRHYQFKLLLQWYAKKYGKIVIDVNEAYTSKTYNGKIINVGSKEYFKIKLKDPSKIKIIDRDINGARNILLRFITKRVS